MLSQEARLTSTDTKAPLTWLLGMFYSRARQENTRSTFQIMTPQIPGLFYDDNNTDTQSAGFGEVRAKLSSGWSISLPTLTGGIRALSSHHRPHSKLRFFWRDGAQQREWSDS